MKRQLRALAAAGLLVASSLVAVALGGNASADTQICEQYGSTTIQGRYVVQNNRWGTTAQQCINVTSTGFAITTQTAAAPPTGRRTSYPSVFFGCHYTNCSPGTNLPIQVSQISSATSSISYSYVSGATYDAAYDIWLDPTPKRDGVNQMEIMIWFNRQGPIQPIGSVVGTTNLGRPQLGGVAGQQRLQQRHLLRRAVGDRQLELQRAGLHQRHPQPGRDHQLLVPDQHPGRLRAVAGRRRPGGDVVLGHVNGGGNPTDHRRRPTPPPGGGAGCAVKYTANSWNNGFTADVQITNTGSSAINGWTLNYSLPGGQTVTNAWNATVSQSGSAVTARNVGHNGSRRTRRHGQLRLPGHPERVVLVADQLLAQRGNLLPLLTAVGA